MPRSRRPIGFVLALLLAAAGAAWADGGALAGRVETSASPLSTVKVYAYALADLSLRKELTDGSGVFLFDDLPAGLYKIVAFKRGFVPAVVMLSRASQDAIQFLEVKLNTPPAYSEQAAESFWKVRDSIPTDVLRDIDMPVVPVFAVNDSTDDRGESLVAPGFQTQMRATTGTQEGSDVGPAQVAGAQFDVSGRVKDVLIDLEGGYTTLASNAFSDDGAADGSTQALSLRVANSNKSSVGISSSTSRLEGPNALADGADEVAFQRHQLSWTQSIGRRSSSTFSAQYVEESNFYRQAHVAPSAIPGASRSLRLEGSYASQITDRSNFQAGVRYHDREMTQDHLPVAELGGSLPEETVEIFGRAGWQAKPAVVVQYGLYSALRDGTVSLAPQGGLVLQLSENWRASTTASRRVDADEGADGYRRVDFRPAYFRDARSCGESQEYCYEFAVARNSGDDGEVRLEASHRKIGETQRLFFDSDFFDRFDSLYLVDGDTLPEFKLAVTHRITPNILTRIESNIGAGGGGTMQTATDTYQNDVSYLVTSIDTTFEDTDTGLYFAFHRLQQELTPLDGAQLSSDIALERLQLGVSQELGFLSRLASDLAVHLDMELSRGGPQDGLEELRKRITGGLAVTF